MFIAILSTITRRWKPSKFSTIDKWIDDLCNICTMKTIKATRKDKVMQFTAIWIKPEGIMLSKVSQKNKDKYQMFSPIVLSEETR